MKISSICTTFLKVWFVPIVTTLQFDVTWVLFTVSFTTLSHDPEVIERLACRDEFIANVEHEGEIKVIKLLRDTEKRGSKSPDVCVDRPSDDSHYHTCVGCPLQRRCGGLSSLDHPDVPRRRKETSCQHHKSPRNWKMILFRSLLPRGSESERDGSDDSDQGDFTSFDIWCAGLSPNTFKDIGGDLDAYKVLLDRSLRAHISEALDLTDVPTLSGETKAATVNASGICWQ
jgi:hypothetical protein